MGHRDNLLMGLVQLGLKPLTRLNLFFQGGLGCKLGLGNLFDEHLTNLNVRNVAIVNNLLDDLLDEHRALHLMTGHFDLFEVALVFGKGLEDGVVVDEVGIHLDEILVVEGHLGILDVDHVPDLVVLLHELPQLVALAVVGVLHDEVRTLNGASDLGTPIHDFVERRAAQRHDKAPDAVDAHEDVHVVSIVLREALTVLDHHVKVVGDLLIGVLDLRLHDEMVANLVARGPKDDVGAFIDKGNEPFDQVEDETVLVEVVCLLGADVQNLGGMDLSVFGRVDVLGVLAQVANGLRRDFARQSDRDQLLLGGDEPAGMLDDRVDRVQGVLNRLNPPLINLLDQHLALLLKGRVAGLEHLIQIAEIPILILDGTHLLRKAAVEILDGI